jgi:hypothetical protein
MTQSVRLSDFLGTDMEEDFANFDMTEVEEVMTQLHEVDAIDLPHAELLQQQALRGADIVTGYLGKIVKTISYLETKVNSTKNRISLEYMAPEGRTTVEMKKWAGEVGSPELEQWQVKLGNAKGSKLVLDRKYELLVKTHHHYKDIAQGLRRTVLGYNPLTTNNEKVPEGYE